MAPVYIVPLIDTELKASYGTGFKAPSLEDLYVNFLSAFPFLANPNLKPEESAGWDVGFEQPIDNDRFRFGSTYFRNDIRNLITSVTTTTPGVTTLGNVNTASTFGAENFAAWQVSKYFNLRADYTYTVAKADSTVTCVIGACAGGQLLRRPKNKASLTASWRATDRLSLSSTLLYIGSWWDITRQAEPPTGANDLIKSPGFTTVNLAANYALRDDVTLFARIDNLFNKQYEDPSGFLRPGFGAYAGVRLTEGGLSSSGASPDAMSSAGTIPPAPSPRSQGTM